MNNLKQDGFFKRKAKGLGQYVVRRGTSESTHRIGRQAISENYRSAKQVISLTPLDPDDVKAGLHGRYEDGGAQRFRQLMAQMNVKDHDLPGLERARKRASALYLVASITLIVFAIYQIAFAGGRVTSFASAANIVAALGLGLMAVKADFSRWQISERRFGALTEYMQTRTKRA